MTQASFRQTKLAPMVGSTADGQAVRWLSPLGRVVRFEAAHELGKPQLAALLADPARPLREFAHQPVKLSHTSLVVEAELELGQSRVRVAYKQSRPKNWWRTLAGSLRESRAARAWKCSRYLAARGVPTARPLFMLADDRGDFLATQWIEGSTNLHLYLWSLAKRNGRERLRRLKQAGESVARLLAALHAAGCSHRDLKPLNLVVSEQPESVSAWLVDLDGARPARITARVRARNLGRMAASLDAHPWIARSDRLRFLRGYLQQAGLPASSWKDFWRAIDRWRVRNLTRIRRQDRPMS